MIYKDYIELMKDKGYDHSSVQIIDIYNPNIKTFHIKKGTIGKIIELSCPENTIFCLCGQDMGCNNDYKCEIKCFDTDGKEPFSKEHKAFVLYTDENNRSKGSIMDIVVTKVVKDEKSKKISEADNYPMLKTVMRIIKSNNSLEYPMIMGIYKKIPENLVKKSFNLYPNEKIIFYAIEPDIDIVKIDFGIELDILEKKDKK